MPRRTVSASQQPMIAPESYTTKGDTSTHARGPCGPVRQARHPPTPSARNRFACRNLVFAPRAADLRRTPVWRTGPAAQRARFVPHAVATVRRYVPAVAEARWFGARGRAVGGARTATDRRACVSRVRNRCCSRSLVVTCPAVPDARQFEQVSGRSTRTWFAWPGCGRRRSARRTGVLCASGPENRSSRGLAVAAKKLYLRY